MKGEKDSSLGYIQQTSINGGCKEDSKYDFRLTLVCKRKLIAYLPQIYKLKWRNKPLKIPSGSSFE